MSFRSLLFCPDETAARLVTQVLSELDFTVEIVHQSFAAVQRLAEEHFHALVVDCQNEQDASLLFKAARNSAQNSGSLSVAVVEGQAGVAKAFRIGANLVLTKPINVEQSKSTLRVARGLLKKAQPKSTAGPVSGTDAPVAAKPAEVFAAPKPSFDPPVPAGTASVSSAAFSGISKAAAVPATAAPVASVPFSGLVLDSEPEPVTEAADAALLESMPEITGKRSGETSAPVLLGRAEPIAASTSGQAAAAALAPVTKSPEARTAGAAPMVSNEPIVSTGVKIPEPEPVSEPEPMSAPSFSSLESSGRSSGGIRFLKIVLFLALVTGGGYFAWQQPQVRQYAQKYAQKLLHRGVAAEPAAPVVAQESTDAPQPATTEPPVENAPVNPAQSAVETPEPTPSASAQDSAVTTFHSTQPLPKADSMETIEVQELPMSRDSGKVTVTPKPQPIVVTSGPATEKSAVPAPPPIDVVSEAGDAKLPSLAPANVELPKPAPGTIRISQGVSQGLLVKKVQPVYPSVAKQFHKQGTVQLLATIDKSGGIKKVQILSGDPILSRAAVDAVKRWEYRPYLLNGQPVEIETQVTIVFQSQN